MDSSLTIIEKVEKEFYKWKINLIKNFDSIIFKIINGFNIYESTFYLRNLQFLLSSKCSIDEIINNLLNYFDNNKIRIEENEKYLKLILINDNKNIELIINEKNKLSEEIIEQLIQEIKNLKDENKQLELRIKNLEKDNKNEKNEDIENKENKINEMENKIKKLEKYTYKKQIQLTHCNLKQINSINPHYESINSILNFPSGNIISVSKDKSIKIYDNNLNIIQNISNAHDNSIFDVSIKDENNFVTCSKDIKTWIKMKKNHNSEEKQLYCLNQIIKKAHDDWISKIIYCLNGNLISCSFDKTIKIWEENNNNEYNCIKILTHNNLIVSILLLEDKNILISSGLDGTKFWNLNNYECIIHIKEVICRCTHALQRIDEDRIILGGNQLIQIISLNQKKKIKDIKNDFFCYGICIIENKGIFLITGKNKEIKIYRNNDYECIKIIKNAHDDDIYGICELNDGSIISYGKDKKINVWSF